MDFWKWSEAAASSPIWTHVALVSGFAMARLFFWQMSERIGLKRAETKMIVAAGMVSYLHSIPVCALALSVLYKSNWSTPSPFALDVGALHTPPVVLTVAYTNSFMIYDAIAMLVTRSNETLYILHHFASMFYCSSSLVIGRGGMGTVLCIWWGEMTNPLQNCWYIVGALADEGFKPAIRAREPLTYATALAHLIIRGIYVPWGVLWLLWLSFIQRPDQGMSEVPLGLRIMWFVLPTAVTLGSSFFVKGILEESRQRREKSAGKKQ